MDFVLGFMCTAYCIEVEKGNRVLHVSQMHQPRG